MAQIETDPTRNNDPSKVPSPWVTIDDVFQEWKRGLGSSREAVGEVEDFLRDPDTRSAYSADGERPLIILDAEFWRDMAWPEAVPDADGVGDHLEVHRPCYVHGPPPFVLGGTFLVLRDHAARWARHLYFPRTAAPPPAPSKERKPAPKKKRRKTKPAQLPQPKPVEPPQSAPTLEPKNTRYAKDDGLVAEGVEGIKNKKYANAQKAAEALASQAEGPATEKSKVDRLRHKIQHKIKGALFTP